MKHTITVCDLCGDRILHSGFFEPSEKEGALAIRARKLRFLDDEFDKHVVHSQWNRRKYHICAKS